MSQEGPMRPIRKPLVAGNWKMNGDRASIASLLEEMLVELDAAKVSPL